MKRKTLTISILALLIAIGGGYAIYGIVSTPEPLSQDLDFSSYISAYTSGSISTREPLRVIFSSDRVSADQAGKAADSRLFQIRPSVKGSLTWHNERTLEFRPEKGLAGNTEYRVSIGLDRLYSGIPKESSIFSFSLRTIKQAMEVRVDGLEFYDDASREDRRVKGVVQTADYADDKSIQETVKAQQNGKSLNISWSGTGDGRSHIFFVEGVTQAEEPGTVNLSVKGNTIGADYSDNIPVDIPAMGEFRVLSHFITQSPSQYIEIRFSEPVDPTQNLNGLIRAAGVTDPQIIIEANLVRIYPHTRLTGTFNFEISDGIRSSYRQRLAQSTVIPVTFEVVRPQVRLVGQGVIIPSTGGILFPFQAVGLKAVDVSVVRIFEQNIAQFLQVNSLSGQSELRRVGRLIMRKTVMLDQAGQVDFNAWNTYNIDLAELISAEPGAVYQVNINFRKEYSTYGCGEEGETAIIPINERYRSSDDIPQTYYYYDDYEYFQDYEWRERDNPCHVSYYRNRSVSRNVLASDLGIIAKGGADGSLSIAVTDLNTARPLGGVEVEIINYQQVVIGNVVTDNRGLATILLKETERPFLALARSGNQKGYLKLDQGSVLSVSSFDVSGVSVQKGLKGFIYGERGVWRPGDTLFVSFILEDKGKTLPENHPVTLEVVNPRGQQVYRTVSNRSARGIYSFPVPTRQDAPTGNYSARIRVGGIVFTEAFRVETIMPNRLKINISVDGDAIRYMKPSPFRFQSSWLHGAPARNLKIKVDAIMSQATTSFQGYNGFVFDDPARDFNAEERTLHEGKLNELGEASFTPELGVYSAAPGMLNANITARVFEEGGAFSIDRFTIPYYPYQNFVGLKLPDSGNRRNTFLTDTTHTIELVSVSSEGSPVANQSLNIEVYKIDWRWWWERRGDNLANYISGSNRRPIARTKVTTNAQGRATYALRINNPEWGRFLIRVTDEKGGHAAGVIAYFDWPGWVSRDSRRIPEAASMLEFATDKDSYNVNETVHVTIPTPDQGRVLLTIESGVKVLQTHWIDTNAGETSFSFAATGAMAPNVYINAMLIQPHGQTDNDRPIRMYGIVPISVEDPGTHLTPVITMPDVLEPEQGVSITVSEKDGKPMAFTLAVVDDGLLDLTRFRTPDPWRSFYAREALGVRTWDLYDLVLGASAGRMQRIISIGGDEDLVNKGDRTADRFKPVVRYFGPFELGRGRKEQISFNMPNYVGSVRVMAVAAMDGAYGSTAKTVPVRKPLMVLATLPRVLGPEEEVVLPVSVFAMEKNIRNVKVRIETNDLLIINGPKELTINFDDVGDEVVRFNLKAAPRRGIAKVKVYAESGREKASDEIELDVRNPNPPMTLVRDAIMQPGESWKISYEAFGMQGTNTASVELSTLPPINLGSRLRYLLGYPHGCLEQTVSKAFPQLYISKLAEVNDDTKKSAEENVRYALDRMHHFRTSDGGLSLWPGAAYPDDWSSVYAGHFMLEAQRLGFSLPAGIIENWRRSTQRAAQGWSAARQSGYRNNDLIQAYRLYTLALANSADMGSMNRLRETANLSVAAKWRLAAAYVLAGNPEAARSLINGVPVSVSSYREFSFTYGSDFRDRAMILEALILLDDLERAMPLLQDLSQLLSSDSWMSTQETAFGLLAFSRFAEKSKASDGIDGQIGIHGQSARRFTSNQFMLQHVFDPVQSGSGNVEVKNNGKGVLYARLINHGIPLAGREVAQSNNLQMDVNYFLMNGTRISPGKISQGTDFYVDVKVNNPGVRGNLEQLILSIVVPSGWEIRTSRLDEGQAALSSSPYDYQDIRDDRVFTYFDLPQGQTKSFRIRFNAAYEGSYYMPGIVCEAMYDNSVNSRNEGNWVEVTRD
jgi:alpha-2-macroglobulin